MMHNKMLIQYTVEANVIKGIVSAYYSYYEGNPVYDIPSWLFYGVIFSDGSWGITESGPIGFVSFYSVQIGDDEPMIYGQTNFWKNFRNACQRYNGQEVNVIITGVKY